MGYRLECRGRAWPGVLLAVLVAAAAPGAPAAAEDEPTIQVWQWTDRDGVTRYTPLFERVPGYARDGAVAMRPGAGPPPKTPVFFEPDPRAPVAAVPGKQPPPRAEPAAPPPTVAPAVPAAEPAPSAKAVPVSTTEPAAVPSAKAAPVSTAEPAPVPSAEPPPTPSVEAGPAPGSEPAPVRSAEAAPAPSAEAVSAPSADPGSDLDERIRQLESQIAADEETLKQRVSEPGAAADVEVSPELREIAARLPQLQAQLASLQKQRGGSGSP